MLQLAPTHLCIYGSWWWSTQQYIS